MLKYIVVRLLQGLVVILLVSIATFGLMHLAPGDPIRTLVGETGQTQLTQEQLEAISRKWGLDRPWYQQYFSWAANMITGDFGQSIVRAGVPIRDMLLEAAPVTATLNVWALGLSILIAIPAGIIAGVKRYSWFDYTSMVGATFGVALPNFWIALMLIILFALKLGWLPPFGISSWKGYILPVAVLTTEQTAVIARLMRSTTIEILEQDYVRAARAKGLAQRTVLLRHVVRNALLPVVTVIGYRIAFLLSGTVVIESVFAVPGIGRLFVDSVNRLDYQVVQAIVLLASVLVILANLVTDLLYAYIDPRIRLK